MSPLESKRVPLTEPPMVSGPMESAETRSTSASVVTTNRAELALDGVLNKLAAPVVVPKRPSEITLSDFTPGVSSVPSPARIFARSPSIFTAPRSIPPPPEASMKPTFARPSPRMKPLPVRSCGFAVTVMFAPAKTWLPLRSIFWS
jgi:hypothetical protein